MCKKKAQSDLLKYQKIIKAVQKYLIAIFMDSQLALPIVYRKLVVKVNDVKC